MVAENFNSFGQAIIKKLVAEIALHSAPQTVAHARRGVKARGS